MNVDPIFETFNRHQVGYLLIGGMNFLLRHQPVLTFDVDLWIEDTAENRARCEAALCDLGAEWGRTDADWGPVANKGVGWLSQQGVFSLNCAAAPVDVFRRVEGLASWNESRANAVPGKTQQGTPYFGLSDEDMLKCQLALDEGMRRQDRVRFLEQVLRSQDEKP
ncbi:MAG TPA: hypothetical protein VMP01_06750 [Pirellulaceae bacterium]|nr:hypothetical protein [Pirellulaceae bacterium]